MKRIWIYAPALSMVFFASCGRNTVETKPVRRDITETVFASGMLATDEQYSLKAKTDGYLQNVSFEEGDQVSKGQVLAVVDNSQNKINAQSAKALLKISAVDTTDRAPALQQIKANIGLAKEKLKQDELQYQRYQKLYDSQSVSKLDYETMKLNYESSLANLKALEQNYALTKKQAKQQFIAQDAQSKVNTSFDQYNQIKALVGGKVYQKFKQEGDFVNKGELVALIGDENTIYAKLSVDENSINKVKLGQKAVVQFNVDSATKYEAVVSEILPSFDVNSQSFYVKAKFTNKPNFKITNTQLQSNIIIGSKKNVLLIPRNFLFYGNKVMLKDKTFKDVKTGIVSNEWVEILEGVTEQDILIEEK